MDFLPIVLGGLVALKKSEDLARREVSSLQVSNKGLLFIKSFEKCASVSPTSVKYWNLTYGQNAKLYAYKDSEGIYTIGWGHAVGVNSGDTILKGQADLLFTKDINERLDQFKNKYGSLTLTQSAFDALFSLYYNVGSFREEWNLTKNLKANAPIKDIMIHSLDITNGGVSGLVKRRQLEYKMAVNGVYSYHN